MKLKKIDNEKVCPVCGTEEMESISQIEGQGDFNRLSEMEARVRFECGNGHTFYKYYDLEYVASSEE